MAYGRDAQAEEILKDAISKEPKRYELHLKLLEIYAGRRDASAFVDIAGELYTTLGASDPMWAKVAEMGAAIEPDNPLYDLGKVAGNSSDIGRKLDASDFADVEVSTDDGLDFSLDAELASVEPEKTAEIASLDMPGFSESLVEQESSVGLDLNQNANNDEILAESESPDLTSFDMSVESAPVEDVANQEASLEKVMDFDLSELGAVADNVPQVVEAEQVEPMVSEIGLDANVEEVMDFDLGLAGELATEASHSETSTQPSVEATLPEIDFSSAPSIDFTSTKSSDEDDLKFEMPVAEVATDALSDFDFNLPTEPQDQDAEKVVEKVASAIGDISFDLGEVADTEAESTLPESELDLPVAEIVELEEPASSEPTKKSKASSKVADDSAVELEPAASIKSDADNQANEFDLSSISLDLDDALNAASIDFSSAADDLNQDSGQESADVEVKLDLVAAYIDMDDREGARELLEEVMKEGGPQQQARAQQLLDNLA
jgi:pilus assembly protein FimV